MDMALGRKIVWSVIRGYQLLISTVLPMSCRFSPSCSAYAAEAVMNHGVLRGGWLALKRMVRCHPWGGWGYDPVPKAGDVSDATEAKLKSKGCSHAG